MGKCDFKNGACQTDDSSGSSGQQIFVYCNGNNNNCVGTDKRTINIVACTDSNCYPTLAAKLQNKEGECNCNANGNKGAVASQCCCTSKGNTKCGGTSAVAGAQDSQTFEECKAAPVVNK